LDVLENADEKQVEEHQDHRLKGCREVSGRVLANIDPSIIFGAPLKPSVSILKAKM
jgi:hypothetical protein